MKRALILLTLLGLMATPVVAKQQLEAPVRKHAVVKKHARAQKHAEKKKEKKHLKRKLAKRAERKHKAAI